MLVTYEGETMRPKELAAKLSANGRPMCRICGVDMGPGRELCVACEMAYEACRADVVAWMRETYPGAMDCMAIKVERGDADGFASKAKDGAK
jgi:hypothetical protein